MMFSGFTSRCTNPRAWAKCSASATRIRISTCATRRSSKRRSSASHAGCSSSFSSSSSVAPSTRFITSSGPPSALTPSACTGTIAGCSSAPVISASTSSALAAAGENASPRSDFTATSRFSARWCASQTSPMPPAPSSSRSSSCARPPPSAFATSSAGSVETGGALGSGVVAAARVSSVPGRIVSSVPSVTPSRPTVSAIAASSASLLPRSIAPTERSSGRGRRSQVPTSRVSGGV